MQRPNRRLSALFSALLLAVLLPLACSSPPGDGDDGGNNSGADTGLTADATGGEGDATSDDGGSTEGDASRDAGDSGTADTGPECSIQADCADDEFCHEGTCKEAPECSGKTDWTGCVYELTQVDEDLGTRAACGGDYCELVCVLDEHCPTGQHCTDFGECRDFTGEITGEDPGGDARAPLKAGVNQELMKFPIGLSLGGYGSRAATDDGRYVKSLRATHGQMHGLYARAFVLDNGERQLMFVRVPMIFTSMALHEVVARKLQTLTGKDWRDSLVISSTHTHSGPGRFFHIPSDALLPLGTFGTDEFHQQAFDWATDSIFRAAKGALEDLSPAQFGMTVVEGFDTDDHISSDRWNQTPKFDDNRLLVMRIDDEQGNPRAVAVSYGTHGTIHSADYFTGDSLGGAERGLEAALAEEFGRFIPVMYFNQNGGSMSPRGGHRGHEGPQRFQKLGHDLSERTLSALKSMKMTRDLELKGATYRFPVTYDLLGYETGEYGRRGLRTAHEQYNFGGLQCGGQPSDSDPSTHIKREDVKCAVGLHKLLYNRTPTLFTRTQMTALQVGDMTMMTMPGEPAMELGWQVLKRLKDEFGVDPLKGWILGYAQSHQFYLTPTNLRGGRPPFPGFRGKTPEDTPDLAYSWLQGGYEAQMSVWGWRYGDYLLDRAEQAYRMMENPDTPRELPEVLPTQFTRKDMSFPTDSSDPDKVGNVVEQTPETVVRLDVVEFGWHGGDPGAEMPQAPKVTLERKDGMSGDFEAAETESLRPYTNREPVMLTRVRRENPEAEDENKGGWIWLVRWEELPEFPTGTYRFKVDGHYLDDQDQRQSYQTTSREFDVVPAEDLKVDASFDANSGTVRAQLAYPAATATGYNGTDKDPGRVTGHFRMRHPEVPTGAPDPLVLGEDLAQDGSTVKIEVLQNGNVLETVTGGDLTLKTEAAQVKGKKEVPITVVTGTPRKTGGANGKIRVTVTDAHGNSGSATISP